MESDKTLKSEEETPAKEKESENAGSTLTEVTPVSGETPTAIEEQPAIKTETDAIVTLTVEEWNKFEAELEESQKSAAENLDGWQRSLAEFSNYKKRIEREQGNVYKNAAGSIIQKFLDVSDDLSRALESRPQEGEGALWSEGIELIYRKLNGFLEAEGVVKIDAAGKLFDPNLHEAISQEESEDHESGHIIEVVQNGYRLGDRVLRPAKVRVAR